MGLQLFHPEKGIASYQFEHLGYSENFTGNRHVANINLLLNKFNVVQELYLQERINKSKQSQKERMDKIKAEQEKNAKKLEDAAENDEKVKAELEEVRAEQEKNKKKETTPAETEVEDTDETPKPKKGEEEESDFDAFGTAVDDEEEPEEETEEVDKTDNSKEGMTKRVDAVIAKAEESGDEAKIKKAKDLKAKILAKESWQLNNTKLGLIFESDLRKMEMESLIQESISIKDRFSKLI